MTMTFFARASFTILLSGSFLAGIHSQCNNIGCPNDSTLGFATIDDLLCAMEAEFEAVNQSEPVRDPPYEYLLCPDTTYYSDTPIRPLLNNTIIACGNSQVASASCLVEVQILLTSDEGWDQVEFRGLTFQGGSFATSVVAAAQDSVATFQDCHWLHRPQALESTLMDVNLSDCSMTNTDSSGANSSTFGIRAWGGSIYASNLTVSNYSVSVFLDVRDGADVLLSDSSITDTTLQDPEGFEDFIFLADSASLTLDHIWASGNSFNNFVWIQQNSSLLVANSTFSNSKDLVGSVLRMTSSAKGITVRDSVFSGSAFSLIGASGWGPTLAVESSAFLSQEGSTHAIWTFADISVSDSCFSGVSFDPPVFANNSQVLASNIYSDVQVLRSNCSGIFVDQSGSGSCTEPDAALCSITVPPTSPPTPTTASPAPISVTMEPTFAPVNETPTPEPTDGGGSGCQPDGALLVNLVLLGLIGGITLL